MSSIRFSSHILLLVLPLFSAPLTVKSQEPNDPACPLLNHFPPPHLQRYAPTTDPILGSYLKNLTNAFDTFSSNSSVAGYNTTQTSFSILISHPNYNEKTATGPIWQYHHTAQVNDPRSTKKVTSDTVFRVASVSKLLTMVGVTKAGLNLDASIVKYIPELRGKGKKGKRSWEEVTVLSLGSHLAGIQRDCTYTRPAFQRVSAWLIVCVPQSVSLNLPLPTQLLQFQVRVTYFRVWAFHPCQKPSFRHANSPHTTLKAVQPSVSYPRFFWRRVTDPEQNFLRYYLHSHP